MLQSRHPNRCPQNHIPTSCFFAVPTLLSQICSLEAKLFKRKHPILLVTLCDIISSARFHSLKEILGQHWGHKHKMGQKETWILALRWEEACIRLSPKGFCDSYWHKFMVWVMSIKNKPCISQSSGYYEFWVQWLQNPPLLWQLLDMVKTPLTFPFFCCTWR